MPTAAATLPVAGNRRRAGSRQHGPRHRSRRRSCSSRSRVPRRPWRQFGPRGPRHDAARRWPGPAPGLPRDKQRPLCRPQPQPRVVQQQRRAAAQGLLRQLDAVGSRLRGRAQQRVLVRVGRERVLWGRDGVHQVVCACDCLRRAVLHRRGDCAWSAQGCRSGTSHSFSAHDW